MTEIPNIYQIHAEGTAPQFCSAFAKGCGGRIVHDHALIPGQVALWGEHSLWRTVVLEAIKEGRTWYYGDHAYFGRGLFYRVTKNALQVSGHFNDAGPIFNANIARFEEVSAMLEAHAIHSEIKIEDRKDNPQGFIMVCPPSEPFAERCGFTQEAWTKMVLHKLKKVTRREIVIRQKPKSNRTPAPFLKTMVGAWAAVTHASNVATESMLGGYPCFTTGRHPADVFGNTDIRRIEAPYLPGPATLKAWAANLCANQWTLDEIRAGKCWKAIQ